MPEAQSFPFNPLRLRLGFFLCALLAAVPGVLALNKLTQFGGLSAAVRASLCWGLCLASLWMAVRLRPRVGWGITLDARALTFARRTGSPLVVPWAQVDSARVLGEKRSDVVVLWGHQRRLLVSDRMFAHKGDFQAFTRALEAHVPPPVYDA